MSSAEILPSMQSVVHFLPFLYKGDNFGVFMFAFLPIISLLKRCLLYEERICCHLLSCISSPMGSKFFSFRVEPFSEERQNKQSCLPCKSINSPLILCMLGNFCMLFCRLWSFFKLTFQKKSFRNTIRVSDSLDSDQAWCFVRPDLGPNCLQRLLADNKSRN